SFFLAAAAVSNLKVSSHVRASKISRTSNGSKKKKAVQKAVEDQQTVVLNPVDMETVPSDMEEIVFSLRNMPDVKIWFPAGLDHDEAKRVLKAAVFNLKMYYGIDEEKE